MRRRRYIRNYIASRVGDQAVDELERWMDGKLDSLADYGVDSTREEIASQDEMLATLARSSGRLSPPRRPMLGGSNGAEEVWHTHQEVQPGEVA